MPAPNTTPLPSGKIEIDPLELGRIIGDAVARAVGPLREITAQSPVPIPQTSIDTTKPGLDDLTVRFHRFCTFQGCGYQRNSEAGFPRAAAEALAAAGSATITYDPRRVRAAA